MNKIKVLLADDHEIVRGGLRALIDALPDAQVIAEAGNGADAVALARKLEPDVVLLDIAMPQLNGIEATARMLQDNPNTRVVILSMHDSAQYVTAAVRAGALGYVLKEAAVDELATALRAAAQGRSWVSQSISGHILESLRNPGAQGGSAIAALSSPARGAAADRRRPRHQGDRRPDAHQPEDGRDASGRIDAAAEYSRRGGADAAGVA